MTTADDSSRCATGSFVATAGDSYAYCLMTNHFHLLVQTPQPNLSQGMQRLNSEYAGYFNERHRLDGHLFQQRFDSRLIETDEYFADAMRYIAFNPVRAGLCGHPAEWPWSSFFGVAETSLSSGDLSAAAMSGAWHRTWLD